ncbi:hypothetical protein [Pontibacter brevis]
MLIYRCLHLVNIIRVQIEKLSDKAADQVAPNIAGGCVLELTPEERLTGEKFFTTDRLSGKGIVFKSPKDADVTPAYEAYIRDYILE